MNILIISAHADDEVLGVGGAAALHSMADHRVYLLSLCDRSMEHKRSEKHVQRLRKCLEKVADILGFEDITYGGLEDERMDLIQAVDMIEAAIAKYKPQIVYTHSDVDINQDHRIALHATAISTRTYKNHFVKKVLTYEVPSSTEQGVFYTRRFNPNIYIDITETMNKKLEAMVVYEQEISDFPFPRSLEGLEALAKVRGMEIGVPRAEAFEMMRERISLNDFKNMVNGR